MLNYDFLFCWALRMQPVWYKNRVGIYFADWFFEQHILEEVSNYAQTAYFLSQYLILFTLMPTCLYDVCVLRVSSTELCLPRLCTGAGGWKQQGDMGACPHSTVQRLTQIHSLWAGSLWQVLWKTNTSTDKTTDIPNVRWPSTATRDVARMCLSGRSCPVPCGKGCWASPAWCLSLASALQGSLPFQPGRGTAEHTLGRGYSPAPSSHIGESPLGVWRKELEPRTPAFLQIIHYYPLLTSSTVLFIANPGHSCHADRGWGL